MAVSKRIRMGMWVAGFCLMAVGCSRIRLPAIDPSGQRIFLPSPASTSLAFPGLPSPAFQDVPVPPPCGTAVPSAPPAAAPSRRAGLHGLCGRRHEGNLIPGRLQLSPTRLIAPTGSEVVLVSGLCGDDGFLVTRQPIEFMLSEDSVGQFVDVADDDRHFTRAFSSQKAGKLSNDYAIAYGSHREQLITRGTPRPNDDVVVAQGQTWLSLTSATEGSSYVTVLAPNAENWDRRLQTATIHWVDAQWTFPSPAIVAAGQPATITTTVTRSNATPLSNAWMVRYEVIGGTPATFGTRGEAAIDVPTDPQGRAGVELVSANADPGTTQIRIQIIRPESNGTPRLVVGEGYTSVTWRAAGLTIQLTGPSTVLVGSPAVYRAIVTNPGDIASHDVVLSSNLPPRITFVGSNQKSERIGDGVQWRLGDLAPRATQFIEIQCRADHAGSLTLFVEAQSREGRKARASTATDIIAPSLAVTIRPEQENVEVGSSAVFLAEITNNGDRRLENLELLSRFDEGLVHVSGQRSPISNRIESLDPGQTFDVKVTFTTRRAGTLCYVLDVSGANAQRASARSCVNATNAASRPKLDVQVTGQERRTVGELEEIVLSVTNSGNIPLTNIRLSAAYDGTTLTPVKADPEFQQAPGEFFWIVPGIRPGETVNRRVHFRCLQAARDTRIRVAASAGTLSSGEEAFSVSIEPANDSAARARNADADAGPASPARANAGELQLRMEAPESIQLGQETNITLTASNIRGGSDRNLNVSILVPRGLEIRQVRRTDGVGGARPAERQTPTGVMIVFERVNEVRENESITYSVTVVGKAAGAHRLSATARSQLAPNDVTVEREIMVNQN